MAALHEGLPGLRRQAATRYLVHRRGIVIAHPDAGHQVAGVSHEPGIAMILAGPGLARRRPAELRRAAGAVGNHPDHHVGHPCRLAGRHHRADRRAIMAEQHQPVGIADFPDAIGNDALPAIGEGAVAAGKLQQADLVHTERQAGMIGEFARQAEPAGGLDDPRPANPFGEPHGRDIRGLGEGVGQRDHAVMPSVEIGRAPVADADRLILDAVRRFPAGLQGRQIDNRLECRAGLALGLRRSVELALAVIPAADHGAHPAIEVERHQRCLPDPGGAAVTDKRKLQRILRRALQRRFQRGDDGDVAVDMAKIAHGAIQHPIGEIARAIAAARTRRDGGALLRRAGGGGRIGKTGIHHARQHLPGAGIGLRLVAGRVIARGRLQQAGQHRRLIEIEVARAAPEIAPGRGIHTIGAGAEIDPVQIDAENLVLAEFLLQPEGEQQFLYLAVEAALRGQEQVLGQLLRDRAATLHHPPFAEIGHAGAGKAEQIDTEMIVEAAVLNGDDGTRQVPRHRLHRQGFAINLAETGEGAAIGGEKLDAGPARLLVQGGNVRQLIGEVTDRPGNQHRQPDDRNQRPF